MTKTIEHIKDRIQFYKTTKVKYEKECIKHPNEKVYEDAVKTCEELIQINEQIKCELEAWEVVKDNVDVYGHEYNGELVEYVQITEEQLPDEKHINIIKKAKGLEAQDE